MTGDAALDPADLAPAGRALFTVDGMWCPSCAAATERVMAGVPGVTSARVSFATSSALVTWDPARVDLGALFAAVKGLGYGIGPPASAGETVARIDAAIEKLGLRLAVCAFFGMWVMVLSVILYLDAGGVTATTAGLVIARIAALLALPVVLYAGTPLFVAGWRTAKAGVPGMDTLVSLGVGAALGLSAWRLAAGEPHVYLDTAVMLIALLSVGRLIEMRTTRQAALALGALAEVLPERAVLRRDDGTTTTVDAERVAAGAVVEVAAGARLPFDGVIVEGETALDRALLTGEARPVPVAVGDRVEAGCVNLWRPLALRVECPVGARVIDRIGGRIAEVVGGKGELQRLAERWARVLVPTAIALAAATLALGVAVGLAPGEAVLRAASVLVVACPCAVGIAVPVAYVAASTRAARAGVLFRNAAAVEALATVRRVLFDKTGTLTEGTPRVVAVRTAAGWSEAEVRRLAAAAEAGIDHPIARALRAGVDLPPAAGCRRTRRLARGAAHEDDLGTTLVGSAELLRAHGVAPPPAPADGPVDAAWIEVARDGVWIGRIAVADRPRDDAAAAVARLEAAGLAPALVTGDAPMPANHVAAAVGIPPTRVHAAQSPEAKAERVAAAGPGTAFVGDGVNDGIALAAADVGVAVTGASNVATAAAGVAVASGGVTRVVDAHAMARRARRIMAQNLGFAVVYNAMGVSLAAFGAVPPVAAALAMVASSLSVLANAARA